MTENRPKTQRGATVYIRRIKSKGYEYLYLMEDVLIDGKKVAKTVANFRPVRSATIARPKP